MGKLKQKKDSLEGIDFMEGALIMGRGAIIISNIIKLLFILLLVIFFNPLYVLGTLIVLYLIAFILETATYIKWKKKITKALQSF